MITVDAKVAATAAAPDLVAIVEQFKEQWLAGTFLLARPEERKIIANFEANAEQMVEAWLRRVLAPDRLAALAAGITVV